MTFLNYLVYPAYCLNAERSDIFPQDLDSVLLSKYQVSGVAITVGSFSVTKFLELFEPLARWVDLHRQIIAEA